MKTQFEELRKVDKINGVDMKFIRYAYDTVILAASGEHLQALINVLLKSNSKMRLEVNQ